jgi:hypothetical protein
MEGSSTHPSPPQLPDRRWQELCTHVRTTDDISFKLLAFVPLVTAAGIAVSVLKGEPKLTPGVTLLSLFAAAVTRALWIWERRNIQTCLWLRLRAATLEEQVFGPLAPGHFYAFPAPPGEKGKTQAERLVYGLTIAAWLLLPGALFASELSGGAPPSRWLGAAAYAVAAVWLGVQASRALHARIEVNPEFSGVAAAHASAAAEARASDSQDADAQP